MNPFDISDEQILEIVHIVRENERNGLDIDIPHSVFSIQQTCVNTRFNHSEFIYAVSVGRDSASMLPDF